MDKSLPGMGGLSALVLCTWAVSTLAMGDRLDAPFQPASDYVSPERVEGATTISLERAHELWQEGVPFVDPRTKADYLVGHIPGAARLRNDPDERWVKSGEVAGQQLEELTEESLLEVAAKDEPVVFYCNGVDCPRSSGSAALAVHWGWEEVYYLRHGFPAWQDAGYEVGSGDDWPDSPHGPEYYRERPERSRWINNVCDRISMTAWTPAQEKTCKAAKMGLLQYLQERSKPLEE
ncbi:MAG: rhodanese-like domain-containing protein [Thiohalorhabdus sp.]